MSGPIRRGRTGFYTLWLDQKDEHQTLQYFMLLTIPSSVNWSDRGWWQETAVARSGADAGGQAPSQTACLHLSPAPAWAPVCAHSRPTLCDPRTAARQAPLSMGFSRQEYWSGLPFPSPGDLPNPGMQPTSPMSYALRVGSLLAEPLGKLGRLLDPGKICHLSMP